MAMLKRIISLVVFLLVMNACVRWGTVYFHDQQFKDAIPRARRSLPGRRGKPTKS